METFLELWTRWAAAAVVDLTVVVAAITAIDALIGSRIPPRVRHGLWWLVLLRMILLPLGVPSPVPLPTIDLPIVWTSALVSTARGASAAATLGFLLWAVGAAVFAVLCLLRSGQALAALRPCVTNDLVAGVRLPNRGGQTPGDRRHREHTVLTGLWRPRLVLPANWAAWPVTLLKHAVGHELTHLRRRDLWVEALWLGVAVVYWFHPLVHLARRRAHDARELCCDADAAHLIGDAYRASLLELIAVRAGLHASRSLLVPRHGWHPDVGRLKALDRWPSPPSRRARAGAATILAGAAFAIVPTYVSSGSRHSADLMWIVDPLVRQESGLGSLHVRYELMRLNNLERSAQ